MTKHTLPHTYSTLMIHVTKQRVVVVVDVVVVVTVVTFTHRYNTTQSVVEGQA